MLESKLNFAAIDIGSNAVRLLIKGIYPGETVADMTKCLLLRIPLRLGEDAFSQGKISEVKEKQLIRTIKSFRLLMKVFRVISYRACATSAMRDASNGRQIAELIEKKTGIKIEVIDGVEEARIVYESHIGDLLQKQGNYIYVDVGGGSTEVSLIRDGVLKRSRSYNIGTVRILTGKVNEESWQTMRKDMAQLAAQYPDLQIIGSGGNINKLYTLSEKREQNYLSVVELRHLYEVLRHMTLEQRISRFRFNPDRADVIVPACEIFLTIAEQVGTNKILVPTIGITDGLTHTLCAAYLKDQLAQECALKGK